MRVEVLTLVLVMGSHLVPEPERHRFVSHGYELLPNTRWLEELESNGRGWDVSPFRLAAFEFRSKSFVVEDRLRLPLGIESDRRLFKRSWSAVATRAGIEPSEDATYEFLFSDAKKEERKRVWSIYRRITTLGLTGHPRDPESRSRR